MLFKRKIYDKLLQWKEKSAGEKAILIEGAMRIGKSTIAEKYSITSLERFMDKIQKSNRQRICYSSKEFKQKG